MVITDQRKREILNADVVVVGGGAAGVSTAVTAARQGLDVVLLERYGFCGGAAVAGLSGTICGMYATREKTSAPPEQIVFGFAAEFTDLLQSRGGVTGPVRYGKTFTRVHEPLVWREAADHLLAEAGVRVIFHAVVTDVLLEGRCRVAGVEAYTKQGRVQVRASLTVDASGDADLIAMSGFSTSKGRDGFVQNPTMIFRLAGVEMERFLTFRGVDSILGAQVSEAIVKANAEGKYYLPRSKIFLFTTPRDGELLCNVTRVIGGDGRELDPLDARDLSEAESEGRRQVREYARFLRDSVPGCEDSYVNDTGVQVGIRQSRQAVGLETLTNSDVMNCRKRNDGIALSAWPIELHTGTRPYLQWLINDYYEIPFGSFVPLKSDGILVAGRCLSAEHEAMASARVTAQCFSYGQAIGHAAAMSVKDAIPTSAIQGDNIRLLLNRDGARLDG
ncbi:MAG: FAD-dependent oxidoreductase [Alphaproteobacteria bacterium]|nr:MAG: FAD-dependent oxidoreductase [Alphaproteobacteria bacterium]